MFALGGNRINLIEKNNRRSLFPGLFEQLPQFGLALAVILGDHLRSADGKKHSVSFAGYGAGQQGLAASGWIVEKHALGRINAEPCKNRWMT